MNRHQEKAIDAGSRGLSIEAFSSLDARQKLRFGGGVTFMVLAGASTAALVTGADFSIISPLAVKAAEISGVLAPALAAITVKLQHDLNEVTFGMRGYHDIIKRHLHAYARTAWYTGTVVQIGAAGAGIISAIVGFTDPKFMETAIKAGEVFLVTVGSSVVSSVLKRVTRN